MGRVKAWAMEEQYCVVCSKEFIPFEVMDTHEIDLGAPTCSLQCSREYHGVMNALADMQEHYCPECEQPIRCQHPKASA